MKKHLTVENALIALLALAVLFALAKPAKSDEIVIAESVVGVGGLLCDTTEEVSLFADFVEAGVGTEVALEAVPGCGILLRPLRMRVTAVAQYTTGAATFQIVRYDFHDVPIPPQFGIGSRVAIQRTDI